MRLPSVRHLSGLVVEMMTTRTANACLVGSKRKPMAISSRMAVSQPVAHSSASSHGFRAETTLCTNRLVIAWRTRHRQSVIPPSLPQFYPGEDSIPAEPHSGGAQG